jgi:hypothetical protein
MLLSLMQVFGLCFYFSGVFPHMIMFKLLLKFNVPPVNSCTVLRQEEARFYKKSIHVQYYNNEYICNG